jgi:Rhodanese-like domain
MLTEEIMNKLLIFSTAMLLVTGSAAHSLTQQQSAIPNPAIDAPGFQQTVRESAAIRESRRLTEAEFLQAMQEKGVVVLDARSTRNFDRRHIKGAVNLPFTEFTAESLAAVIPNKNTKILIYCNNNFQDTVGTVTGNNGSFATKAPSTALNLSTYATLRGYGYTNVYELGPLLEISSTKLPFVGTEVPKAQTKKVN